MSRRPRQVWEEEDAHDEGVREGPTSSGSGSRGDVAQRHAWDDAGPAVIRDRMREEGFAVDEQAIGAGSDDTDSNSDSGLEADPTASPQSELIYKLLELYQLRVISARQC